MKYQGKSIRKPTGGRLRPNRGKRKFEMGSEITQPVIGASSRKVIEARGNCSKVKVLKENVVNVTDPKSGKTTKSTMTTEVNNPANKNYIRRNILTKGAVVMTALGKAKITSRPGQDGEVNAVLVGE